MNCKKTHSVICPIMLVNSALKKTILTVSAIILNLLKFEEIRNILGIPIDHSFLKYKKELTEYGYQVGKISMKEQTVIFNKID